MKIAVVDDDKHLHSAMTQFFLQFQIANDCDLSVEYYFSCEEVYRQILSGRDFDLLLVDTVFSGMHGTEFALLLRNRLHDYETRIVFLSSVKEYSPELFKIRPAGFLVKPVSYEMFSACLSGLLEEYAYTSDFLDYTLENTKHRIRVREILYLKAEGKKVAFHTKEDSFSVYGKIADLIAGCAEEFLCISRGEFVNIRHVMSATPREVHLTGNLVLHISRGRMQAVRERLAVL